MQEPVPGVDEVRAAIAATLDVDPAQVREDDDLIGLGLDSLRMMGLAGRWRRAGIPINFARLAAEPTPAAWARLLAETARASAPGPEAAALPRTAEPAAPGAAPDGEPFPLAPMAHAYWAGRQADDLAGVGAHLYVEFDGAGVDPARLRAATHRLLQAHPMLRARVLPDGTQLIGPAADIVTITDLTAATPARVEAELKRLRDERTHQLLDVEAGQMLDVSLTRLPGGATRLHVDVDMIAADAVSYRILMRDLAAAYTGAELPAPTSAYRDYLRRPPADSAIRAADESFWRGRLPELPGAPELPLSPAGRAGTARRVRRLHHRVDAAGRRAVEAAARARGVTPAMALAAVFADTVGRWSARERFLLNLPLFDREPIRPDIDAVIGDFTSSVLLEVDASGATGLADRARTLQETLHRNAAHATVSGVQVLRMLGRAQGRQVLAPVVYTSAIGLGELFEESVTAAFGDAVNIVSQGPQVLLDAQVTEFDGGLLLNWDIRDEAFEEGVADAMFAHYRAGLAALTGDEWDAPAGTAGPPGPQAPRRAAANATGPGAPPRTLHGAFFDRAAAHPERPAVLGGATPLTYGLLADRARAVAGALLDAGLRRGQPVAVRLPKGAGQPVAVLGVLAAGGHYVPVGYAQPAARRDAILSGAGAELLLDDGTSEDLAPGVQALPLDRAIAHAGAAVAPSDPHEVAYVLYTSGSTGTPKGVEVSHAAAANTLDALIEEFDLDCETRTLAISALEFDLSVFDVFAPLATGGAIIVLPEAAKADPRAWQEAAVRHRASVINAVPAVLDLLLGSCEASATELPELGTVLLGGDRVGVDLIERTAAVAAPMVRFAGLGGATETAIHSTVCEVAHAPRDWDHVPYGRPLAGVCCRVVDAAGRDAPDHVAGELWIGGRSVALGYRGDPSRSADRFVEHGGMRWYRTGDRARYDSAGSIEFLGRVDNQVKVRGHRVELGEVEAALRCAPGVTGAIARVHGEGARATLIAAVTGEEPGAVDPARVLAAAAELVPGYLVPVRVAVLDRFPLTGNGKIDRAAVGRALIAVAPRTEAAPPRTCLERALVALAADAIGIAADELGVGDDFFGLGGDSVQATALVTAIRSWLDAPTVTVADVFAGRTVAGIAELLAAADPNPERLETIAQLYLEVAALTDAEVAALETAQAL